MINLTRGTTPTVVCKVPEYVDLTDVSEVWLTIKQNTIEITHTLSEGQITIIDDSLVTNFSQSETLQFTSSRPAECGVRIKKEDGTAWSLADPHPVKIHAVTKDGEI